MGKWTVLIVTFFVFILFQNMDWVDIRELAPEQPLAAPQRSLFPSDIGGASSPQNVAERMLQHRFGEELRSLESDLLEKGRLWGVALFLKDEHPSSISAPGSGESSYLNGQSKSRSLASVRLLDPNRIRFYVLDSSRWYLDFNMPDQSLLLNYKTELTSRLALHSTFESAQQRTSLWFHYKW